MPPYALDSDDDTPEIVTLASSKKASRTQENAVHAAERALKTKRKRENQEKDRALKMAKAERQREKELREETVGEGDATEERMKDEAQEEDDSDGEEISPPGPASTHLPDHLFSAAAASLSAPSASQSRSRPTKDVTAKAKGRKARRAGPKDVLVGSRTIRVLSSAKASSAAASRTLPPPRVDKFLEYSLQFKKKDPVPGDKRLPSKKDWQRRSAHLGVMRSQNGPAPKFVRSGT